MDIFEKILEVNPDENKKSWMLVIIAVTIPIITSIIYYAITTFLLKSGIISIVMAVLVLILWFIMARQFSKTNFGFTKSYLWTHGLMLFGTIFAIIQVIAFPNSLKFVMDINSLFGYYLYSLAGITVTPIAHFFQYKENYEYVRYIPIIPVFGFLLMSSVFALGYNGDK